MSEWKWGFRVVLNLSIHTLPPADCHISHIGIHQRCRLGQFNLASRGPARGSEAASLVFEARRPRLEPLERGVRGTDRLHRYIACGQGFKTVGYDEAEETCGFEQFLVGLIEEGVCAEM